MLKAFAAAGLFVAACIGVFGQEVRLGPAWWYSGEPPVIVSGAETNNKGPANIGQAKYMAKRALDTLDDLGATQLSSDIRTQLVGAGKPLMSLDPPAPADLESQKAALRLGQLKAIAKPFYDVLNEADSSWLLEQLTQNGLTTQNEHYWQVSGNPAYYQNGYYPWDPATPVEVNNAVATIGQLKAVFSLRFETHPSLSDQDEDGLNDAWELANGLDVANGDQNGNGILDGLDDFDADGVSNIQEYRDGTSVADSSDYLQSSRPPTASEPLASLRIDTPLN